MITEDLFDLNGKGMLGEEVVSGFTGGVLSDDFRGGDYSDITGESEKELYNKYKESGSKKTFKDWLNQDSTKNLISSIANIGAIFLAGKNLDNEIKNNKKKEEEQAELALSDKKNKESKTLKNNNTLIIILVSIISLSIIGGVVFYKLKKK